MKFNRSLFAALIAGLAFGSAQAQTKWDMPTPYPDSNLHTKNVKQFADDIKAATGGKLELVVHSNASLIKHPDIKRAVQTGQVPIGEFLVSVISNENAIFAFDSNGRMGARRYVNLELNLSGPQSTNFIEVSGRGSWHGSPHNISSYLARFPVMGPFIEVFVYNRAPTKRTVSVWGYLVS